jgi:hypothetical protein
MKYLLVLALLLGFSCSHHDGEDAAGVKEVKIEDIPDDIKIPVKLWNEIERISNTSELTPKSAEDQKEEDNTANRGSILFSTITVKLKENNPEVLESPEIKIDLPRGGGQIDLAKYMGSKPGSFFVQFEYPEWKEVPTIHSYYVSRAKKRKLDGEVYGVGCNKYLDITKKLAKNNAKEGIKVNTTRDRHATVLGGHFVFSAKKDTQTFLSQVTFVDSKNPQLFCETNKAL